MYPSSTIVLDTNVCLDLLVFDDPRVTRLAEALRSRRIVAMANNDTRAEWIRVLGYPTLQLDARRREALIGAFDALVEIAADTAGANPASGTTAPLPRCSDPDDQKFLELARDTGARWLLSRDQDLLMLAARCRRNSLFAILTPQAWTDGFANGLAAAPTP